MRTFHGLTRNQQALVARGAREGQAFDDPVLRRAALEWSLEVLDNFPSRLLRKPLWIVVLAALSVGIVLVHGPWVLAAWVVGMAVLSVVVERRKRRHRPEYLATIERNRPR